MTKSLELSVVINTYNRAHRILATLEGLRHQTYPHFEVIVVNGPSTDGTTKLLNEYGNNLRIGECPVTVLGVSRNIGIDMAAGDIIAFIDDDAVPRNKWLENLVAGYREPAIGGVGGYVFDAIHNRIDWKICTCTRLGDVDVDAAPPAERYQGKNVDPFLYFGGCNMSFRRPVLVEIGGFDERYAYIYDDSDIGCRVNDAGYRLTLREEAIVDHYSAANQARDEARQPRDLYNVLHGQMVFALQHGRPKHSVPEITAHVEKEAAHHRQIGRNLLDRGVFTKERLELYLQRIEQGMQDGLAAGIEKRIVCPFMAQNSSLFRQYSRISSGQG